MKKNIFLVAIASLFSATVLAGCNKVDTNQRFETVFKNYDQTVLYFNTVKYGEKAEYQGPTPTRPANGSTAYYFNGWDLPLENITRDTTFIAQYTTKPTTFEITWLNYNSEQLAKTTVEYGKMPSYTGKTPSKPSTEDFTYTFKGWDPEVVAATENATYKAVFEEKPVEKDQTKAQVDIVYSVYNPKTNQPVAVHQTKPSDIGYASVSGQHEKGKYINLKVMPSEGYTFIGWYYDGKPLSNQTDYNFKVWDEDIELEARYMYTLYTFTVWSSNASFGTVGINNSGNSFYSTMSMFYTEEFIINAYTKDEIRFIGWYEIDNTLISNNAVHTIAMPNANYQITGKWNKFFVYYQLNGGTVSKSLVENYSYPDDGDRYIDLPTPTKTGYIFQYWTVNGEQATRFDESLLCDFNIVAYWKPIEYTIKFDGNGYTSGSMSSMAMIYDVATQLTKNAFVKEGYTFLKWNTKKDGTGTDYEDESLVNNLTTVNNTTITLYAIWKANNYNVSLYYVNPYNEESTDKYMVTFNTNGAEETIEQQEVYKNHNVKYPGVLHKDGYAFTGWFEDSTCTQLYDFRKGITGDTTIYAGWNEMYTGAGVCSYFNALDYSSSNNAYSKNVNSTYCLYFTAFNSETVNFYYKNSRSSSSYRIHYYIFEANGSMLNTVANGSTYSTSYSSTSFNIIAGHSYMVQLYYANYSSTLYFYFTNMTPRSDNDPSEPQYYGAREITFDSNYTLPTVSAEGCNFLGWFDSEGNQYTDENGQSISVWKKAEDTNLYTKWEYIEYSITYNLNDGTNSKDNPSTYIVKDNIELKDPEKKGYEFGGWYLDSGFENKITVIKEGNYHQNLQLYAKWTAKKYQVTLVVEDIEFEQSYTVSFITNGGGNIPSQTITSSSGLVYPTVPTKSGYAFSGWYKDSDCTQLFNFTEKINEDTTLYAGWVSMVTSYYTRNYFNAVDYNSSSINYSISSISTSGNYTYLYFTAFNSETVNFYYKNSSTSTYYRVYFAIYDATTGYSVSSGSSTNTSYYSNSFTITEGHVYYIRLYKSNSSYSPTFYFYFTGMSSKSAGGTAATTHIYKTVTVTYDYQSTLPHDFYRDGYKFTGWFDSKGNQYTDEYGTLLNKWNYDGNITLYAHWEAL